MFAAGGIVYPVVLLSSAGRPSAFWWRGSVVAAFVVGLLGVLAYLGWTVRLSTRTEAAATAPLDLAEHQVTAQPSRLLPSTSPWLRTSDSSQAAAFDGRSG